MGLSGNITNMPLIEAIRIVNLGQSSGSLTIRSGEKAGVINFHLGEIVYAGIDNYPLRIGDMLINQKHLTKQQLEKVLAIQHNTKPWRPMGEICVEMGFVNKEIIREVVSEMITAIVSEMLAWENGFFRFEDGKVTISDQISLNVRDLLLRKTGGGVTIDVENLVQRIHSTAPQGDVDPAFNQNVAMVAADNTEETDKAAAEESAAEAEEPSDEFDAVAEQFFTSHPYRDNETSQNIFRVYREGSRLKEMLASLNRKRSQGEITLLLLNFASDFFQRVILFIVQRESLQGVGHFGLPTEDNATDSAVRKLVIPTNAEPFHNVINQKQEFIGEIEGNCWKQHFSQLLGNDKPRDSAILPIAVLGKPALLLYGDHTSESLPEDITTLKLFNQQVGMAYEIALLSQKK